MADDSKSPLDSRPIEPADEGPADREPLRLIRSKELFAGERIVLIEHAGEQYRLLITRNDRLILQK